MNNKSEPGAPQPRSISPEERQAEREVHQGAQDAGVRISGLTEVDDFETSFAGSKAEPVEIGHKITVRVRVAEDGTLLPRREDSDASTPPATSILNITVIPSVEFDSDGNPHVVWNGHARQVDVATARVFASEGSGPSRETEETLQGGRPIHEYGNDPEYTDGMLGEMAQSRGEAVTKALAPLVGSDGRLRAGSEKPRNSNRTKIVAAVAVPVVLAGVVIGFSLSGGSKTDPVVTDAPSASALESAEEETIDSDESPEADDDLAEQTPVDEVPVEEQVQTEPEAVEPEPEPEPLIDPLSDAVDTLALLFPQLPTATPVGGGMLSDAGSFLDSSGAPQPLGTPISFVVLPDGTIAFGIPRILLGGSVSMEFDALASDGLTVVSETSLVGSDPPPSWVAETPHGTVRDVPPPDHQRRLPEQVGELVISDIKSTDDFVKISIWIYRRAVDGGYQYANAEILKADLEKSNPDLAASINDIWLEFQALISVGSGS